MNIDRLDLIAFGHLTDVTVDLSAGPNRFHMIVGKNESGKSTSMRAIDAWLYGFPVQTKDDYLHPMKKLRVGGVIRDGENSLHCIRKKGRKGTVLDGADGKSAIDDANLESMLAGIDQATFGTQFLINHNELVDGGRMILQGEGELGEMLFAAGAGLGRLKKVQDELRAEEEALLKKQGKSKITDALKASKETRETLKQSQVPPAEYAELEKSLAAKRAELDRLKQESESLSEKRAVLAAQIDALPIIPAWQSANEEFSAVASAAILEDSFSDRRRDVSVSIDVASNNVKRLQQILAELNEQLSGVGEDGVVLKHRSEIETLLKELPVREKGEVDRTGYMTKVLSSQERDLRKRIADLAQDSKNEVDKKQDDNDDLTSQVDQFRLNETQRNKVGRLAASYAQLVATSEDTQRQVAKLSDRISKANEELKSLERADPSAKLTRVLSEVDSPTNLAKTLSEAVARRDLRKSKCETISKRLGADTSIQQWISTALPDQSSIDGLTKQLDDCDDELQVAIRDCDDLKNQLADAEAEYEAIETGDHLPSAASLQQARSRRNEQLERLSKRSGVLAGDADAESSQLADDNDDVDVDDLIQWVRRSDEIVDQLRLHQKEVTQRESMVVNIRRLTTKAAQAAQRVAEKTSLLEQTKQEWRDLWSVIGVTAKSPAAMKDWIGLHQDLVEQADVLAELESEVAQAGNAIKMAIKQLSDALQSSSANIDLSSDDSNDTESLFALYDLAKTTAEQEQKRQREYDSVSQRIAGMQADLQEAESMLSQRTDEMKTWQSQWDAATASLSSASPTPDDIVPMLDAIKDLGAIKKERDDLLHRMTSIENETAAYGMSVARLIKAIDGDGADNNAELDLDCQDTSVLLQRITPLIESLGRRVDQAAENEAERSRLSKQIQAKSTELENESADMQRLEVLVADLCREAGCEQPDQLPEFETQSRLRQKIADRLHQAEVDLKRLARGQSIESFIDSIKDAQPGVLEEQLEDSQRQRTQVAKEIETITLELGELNLKMRQIDGGTKASEISQTLASQLGEIGHDAEQYVRLRLASGILRRAIEHYRGENQEPVMKIAEGYFRELTCGDYVGLKVDYDDKDHPVLHGVRDGNDDVPASSMSDGTADSLYLAMRLASLKHRCDQGKPMPLIVDDCLQQLDNDRAVAAMKVLSQLSTQTQVIMFTHHEHLVDLTQSHLGKNDVHVHRLAG
ncbi:hypothetical protein LF1_22850 [Rubripirellula obstinata]|uniref:YhaN AAA domain-containing protein n=1 Tax=Rubripirellula obstinata TaxID=406547 RepID=A0A5B1CF17_9BACT|nr:YhaN family protein [Rubripirellula obstinata]KAA1259748.1 hypothetical protein LF1_22850 [Rubripirellula obstinata]